MENFNVTPEQSQKALRYFASDCLEISKDATSTYGQVDVKVRFDCYFATLRVPRLSYAQFLTLFGDLCEAYGSENVDFTENALGELNFNIVATFSDLQAAGEL